MKWITFTLKPLHECGDSGLGQVPKTFFGDALWSAAPILLLLGEL
jgi:hypothetical protein